MILHTLSIFLDALDFGICTLLQGQKRKSLKNRWTGSWIFYFDSNQMCIYIASVSSREHQTPKSKLKAMLTISVAANNITMNLTSGLPSTSSSWWGWSYRSCCPAAPAATPGCSSASWSPSSSPRWRDLPCLSTRTWASASGSGKYECEYTKGKMDVKWKSIHLLETPSLLLSLYHNITNERSLPVVYSANTTTITPARANTH